MHKLFAEKLPEMNLQKVSVVRIDSSLDKYNKVVLFPDKLAKANEQVKKFGFPKLPKKD